MCEDMSDERLKQSIKMKNEDIERKTYQLAASIKT